MDGCSRDPPRRTGVGASMRGRVGVVEGEPCTEGRSGEAHVGACAPDISNITQHIQSSDVTYQPVRLEIAFVSSKRTSKITTFFAGFLLAYFWCQCTSLFLVRVWSTRKLG